MLELAKNYIIRLTVGNESNYVFMPHNMGIILIR